MSIAKEDSDLLQKQVEEGLTKARKKLIAFKKQMNSPLIVSENGKIVAIPADQLTDPSETGNGNAKYKNSL